MLPQTIEVMKELRGLNKAVQNSQKIHETVDTYLDECLLKNEPVTIITPWSLSKRFEDRFKKQGGKFTPTTKEVKLFRKEIPFIESLLLRNGFKFNWYIIFSRSYLDERIISNKLEKEYVGMIEDLLLQNPVKTEILNWEDDVIESRHYPNKQLLDRQFFDLKISHEKLMYEFERWRKWVKEENVGIDDNTLMKQTRYQIACEAEEGRFLMEENNFLCTPGKFLFMVLGRPERYVFFSTLVPEFQKNIVSVLKPYPWRLV